MERDSFIFYRSFYEAIRDLPRDIRLEVYTALMEYALYGRLPEGMKPFAKGLFALMKPVIDTNTVRFNNGCKGGRKIKPYVMPYRDFENKTKPSQYARDLAQYVNRPMIYNSCKFEEFSPRKGFTCNEYFNQKQ